MSDDLAWLSGSVDDPILDAVHRVVEAVMRLGGAVGWVDVPDRAETAEWLAGIAAEVAAGRTRMALLGVAGRVEALGRWTRYAKETVAVNGEVLQVMVHPDARGRRLARRLVAALVEDARAQRVETLTLDVRGHALCRAALLSSGAWHRPLIAAPVARGRWPPVILVDRVD